MLGIHAGGLFSAGSVCHMTVGTGEANRDVLEVIHITRYLYNSGVARGCATRADPDFLARLNPKIKRKCCPPQKKKKKKWKKELPGALPRYPPCYAIEI